MNKVKKIYTALKHHPNLILLKVFRRYLSKNELIEFENKISKCQVQTGKMFTKTLLRNFDIERIKNAPLIWQDIWIYNYCKYEIHNGLRKTQLLKRYELEALFMRDEDF